MSVFEAFMLICFGTAWPLSVWKSYRSRQIAGKSLPFMVIVMVGYISGAIHKVLYNLDLVLVLYILNGLLVATDIALYVRNARLAAETDMGARAVESQV